LNGKNITNKRKKKESRREARKQTPKRDAFNKKGRSCKKGKNKESLIPYVRGHGQTFVTTDEKGITGRRESKVKRRG